VLCHASAGKRQRWSAAEKMALKDLVKAADITWKPPTKAEILQMQQSNVCLASKTWQSIKYQVWALHQQRSKQRCKVKRKLFQWHFLSHMLLQTVFQFHFLPYRHGLLKYFNLLQKQNSSVSFRCKSHCFTANTKRLSMYSIAQKLAVTLISVSILCLEYTDKFRYLQM